MREHYQPVRSVLHEGSDPIGLARAYRDQLGCREIYVADLDAIAGAPPALAIYRALRGLGLSVWLDAGVRDRAHAAKLIEAEIAVAVVGLETLPGCGVLSELVASCDGSRIAFSLDLRGGEPLLSHGSDWIPADAEAIAARAIEVGVRRMIVLDLARVGMSSGVGTLDLIMRVANAYPDVEIVAGGGVSDLDDLLRLDRAGASAALIASALHDGRIGRDELDRQQRSKA